MKQTAIDWLLEELENNDWYWLPESIKNEIINQAKEMELEQRKEGFRAGWHGNKHKDWNCEFYLEKYISNDFKIK